MISPSDPEKTMLTSACHGRIPVTGTNSLHETSLRGKLNIRGDATDSDFLQGIERALGMQLPCTANTLSEKDSRCMYWLGPDEWLLHCDLDDTSELENRIRVELAALHYAITEVSDYYTILRLQGPDIKSLLRKACPLDLHHSVFQPGDFAQTRFGQASILLHKLGNGVCWDLQVRWTYAEYVWDYLLSAMETL